MTFSGCACIVVGLLVSLLLVLCRLGLLFLDEKVLIQIFSERSRTHLVVLDGAYQKMYGRELRKVKIWHFLDRPVSPCDFRIQSGLDKFFPYP